MDAAVGGAGWAEAPPPYRRGFLSSGLTCATIGSGPLGGKAEGLRRARAVVGGLPPEPGLQVEVPPFVVVGADVYCEFRRRNRLSTVAGGSDREVAAAFLRGELPAETVGDLFDLAREAHVPLAVRSSSVLEDARSQPFAGVYLTKMIPNQALDPEPRFRKLAEAIKLVWASASFATARAHRGTTGHGDGDEAMAVVIQAVVGRRFGPRFYPDASGVARSCSFYPYGPARPEDGVADLALGLGKTIVEGGRCWTYCPAHPRAPAPFGGVADVLDRSQRDFWAVDMGTPRYDPTTETECLVRASLGDAEEDGSLNLLASTYDPGRDRIVPGLAARGPRLLDFALLLAGDDVPFNPVLRRLLASCAESLGGEAEIEFALELPPAPRARPRLGLVQLRPLGGAETAVAVSEADLDDPRAVVASARAMGHGAIASLGDVVFLDPASFDAGRSREAALEVARADRALRDEGRPYLLIGFGRWGSADPWLGVPVTWAQVSGARVLVEAGLPGFEVEPSQGAHFFHNLVAARVACLHVPLGGPGRVDWPWLQARAEPAAPGALVRRVRLERPLAARVDGRARRGVVLRS
jgi:hypothetical protein